MKLGVERLVWRLSPYWGPERYKIFVPSKRMTNSPTEIWKINSIPHIILPHGYRVPSSSSICISLLFFFWVGVIEDCTQITLNFEFASMTSSEINPENFKNTILRIEVIYFTTYLSIFFPPCLENQWDLTTNRLRSNSFFVFSFFSWNIC